MEKPVQNEIIFYQDFDVKVTQTRYITHSKTYPMRNISSVYLFEIVKSRKLPVLIIVIGALLLFSNEAPIAATLIVAFGILLLLLIKNEYAVRISTNSGELNSVVSKNRDYVEKIVEALNDAIVHIG